MSLLDAVNRARKKLGRPPLVAAGGNYREWEHPRDKNGQWIEKLSLIKWGEAFAGIIESMNRDGTVRARITHSPDNSQIGQRVDVNSADVEAVDVKARVSAKAPAQPPSDAVATIGQKPWSPKRPVLTGDTSNLGDVSTWGALRESLRDSEVIVFDTETTGLDVGREGTDGPIEIGAVKMVNGEIVDEFHVYIKREGIPSIITRLTGIDDAKVADGLDEITAMEDFIEWANIGDKTVFAAHNANFDTDALNFPAHVPDDIPLLDTLAMARALMPKGDTPVANHKLGTLAEYFGVDLSNAHTASADARATGDLIDHLLEYGETENRSSESLTDLPGKQDAYNESLVAYTEQIKVWRQEVLKNILEEKTVEDSKTTQKFE